MGRPVGRSGAVGWSGVVLRERGRDMRSLYLGSNQLVIIFNNGRHYVIEEYEDWNAVFEGTYAECDKYLDHRWVEYAETCSKRKEYEMALIVRWIKDGWIDRQESFGTWAEAKAFADGLMNDKRASDIYINGWPKGITERLINVFRDFDPYDFDDPYNVDAGGLDPVEDISRTLSEAPEQIIEMLLDIIEEG